MTNAVDMCTSLEDVDLIAVTSIRNTFIDCRPQHATAERRKSLPPSFKPAEFMTIRDDSDDSTDVRTDDGSTSEIGNLSSYAASSTYEQFLGGCEPCMTTNAYPIFDPQLWMQPVASEAAQPWMQPPATAQGHQRLSSKAAAFQPTTQLPKANVDENSQLGEALEIAREHLQQSQNIMSVDVVQTSTGWSIVVTPTRRTSAPVDDVTALAKEALLKAAEESKDVYVLGFAFPETAFAPKPQGFEAQLVVMEGVKRSCWGLLKRGSCRYDTACKKQHPLLQASVQVVVEEARFAAPVQVVQRFKQEAANFIMMVTTMLTSAACSAGVQAFNEIQMFDEDGQGWRIELSIRPEDMCLKDHLLVLAQNVFTEAAKHSQTVYIMGSRAAPFISKSEGFSLSLVEMTDKSQACWDVYMQGACCREQSCRWQHPQCLMPVNVVLKL